MKAQLSLFLIALLLALPPTLARPAAAANASLVYLDPPVIAGVGEGETFVVTVRVDAFVGLYAWAVDVSWDPAVLAFVDATEGSCLTSNGSTVFLNPPGSAGSITVGCTLLGDADVYFVNVPPGPDDFVALEFQVVQQVSESAITIDVTLVDRAAQGHYPDVHGATVRWSANAYLVVRGGYDVIYYRIYNSTSSSWMDWNVIPDGATCDTPAAAVYSGKLYVVVRGMDEHSLWFGSVNLTDHGFSGWTLLSGASPSAPTLVSYGSKLVLVVRGFTNIIYYRSYDCGSEIWTEWVGVPDGATCDSPAAAVLGINLHLVVRGFSATDVSGNNTLWHGYVDLGDDSFSGWTALDGWTPSAPRLAASETLNKLFLAVRGGDNRIWVNTWTGSVWEGWAALPDGATCDSPTVTVVNGELHIVVRSNTGDALWHYYINLSTDAHSGWMLTDGWTPSAPTLDS